MILHLFVCAVVASLHIDHGFDVACLHLHDDSHTNIYSVLLHLFHHGLFCYVLYLHVDGSHNVIAVHGLYVHHLQHLVAHFLSMCVAFLAAQHRVVRHLQPIAGQVLSLIHSTYGAQCQGAEGLASSVVGLGNEASGILRESEHRQFLHLLVCSVVHPLLPYRPAAVFLGMASFRHVLAKLFCRHLGKYLMQSLADAVHLICQQRVLLL